SPPSAATTGPGSARPIRRWWGNGPGPTAPSSGWAERTGWRRGACTTTGWGAARASTPPPAPAASFSTPGSGRTGTARSCSRTSVSSTDGPSAADVVVNAGPGVLEPDRHRIVPLERRRLGAEPAAGVDRHRLAADADLGAVDGHTVDDDRAGRALGRPGGAKELRRGRRVIEADAEGGAGRLRAIGRPVPEGIRPL